MSYFIAYDQNKQAIKFMFHVNMSSYCKLTDSPTYNARLKLIFDERNYVPIDIQIVDDLVLQNRRTNYNILIKYFLFSFICFTGSF